MHQTPRCVPVRWRVRAHAQRHSGSDWAIRSNSPIRWILPPSPFSEGEPVTRVRPELVIGQGHDDVTIDLTELLRRRIAQRLRSTHEVLLRRQRANDLVHASQSKPGAELRQLVIPETDRFINSLQPQIALVRNDRERGGPLPRPRVCRRSSIRKKAVEQRLRMARQWPGCRKAAETGNESPSVHAPPQSASISHCNHGDNAVRDNSPPFRYASQAP